MDSIKNVVMVGLGYIGLPTAAIIAKNNIKVTGVDVNPNVVSTINQGKIHIVEPELDGLVKSVVDKKMLVASTTPIEADVFVIAVPTPFKGNHEPDISYVEKATLSVIPFLKEGDLYILESTSPVGTTNLMTKLIFEKRPELKGKIYTAYCPERVLPGNVIHELVNNDRVIGGTDEASTIKACRFYCHFVEGELHKTNAKTAEMCKLTENSSRDLNIAFANELSIICDKAGINVWELIKLANRHPRVKILQPGTGVGGHCIAVDPWFIVSDYKEEAVMIKAARERNLYKTLWVIEKIKNAIATAPANSKIAFMGLAFKPNIDDLRESPAIEVVDYFIENKFPNLLIVEPNIQNHKKYDLTDYAQAYEKADIVVFLVAHKEFKNLINVNNKIELDFCGIRG
jgi:UDP-N-acetyl-D-mannosaminuronic acid dehydrogenase